jgi:nucleotide-binding universal stress UspA family protein
MRKVEKQRLEREEMEARGFVANLERLLIAVDDSVNGKFASRVAGMLAGTGSMPTTVLHITEPAKIEAKKSESNEAKAGKPSSSKAEAEPPVKASKRDEKKAEKTGETVKQAAAQIRREQKEDEKSDAPVDVTTIVHEAPSAEQIAAEAKKGFEGPLAITDVRGELKDKADDALNILVPVNGTEQSRRAAEVAITLARATQAAITVLYVSVRSGRRAARSGLRTRRHEEAILKDIVAIADGYNMSIRTALLEDNSTDDAIFSAAKRRKSNIIVLGVGRRPGEKLFFGDTAAAMLKDAECSLLFVAS